MSSKPELSQKKYCLAGQCRSKFRQREIFEGIYLVGAASAATPRNVTACRGWKETS